MHPRCAFAFSGESQRAVNLQCKESILACERFSLISVILVCGDGGLLPFHKSAKPLLLLIHQALLAKMPLFGDLAVMHALWYVTPRP